MTDLRMTRVRELQSELDAIDDRLAGSPDNPPSLLHEAPLKQRRPVLEEELAFVARTILQQDGMA